MHNDGEHDDVNDLRDAVAAVRAQVDAAALEAGRDPAEVRLLPVSKTVPVERLRSAVAAGMHLSLIHI